MGYKNENIKHRQGVNSKPKYTCPHCNNGLSITKKVFMVVCSKCKKLLSDNEIIEND